VASKSLADQWRESQDAGLTSLPDDYVLYLLGADATPWLKKWAQSPEGKAILKARKKKVLR
jgi:hypothetical protein